MTGDARHQPDAPLPAELECLDAAARSFDDDQLSDDVDRWNLACDYTARQRSELEPIARKYLAKHEDVLDSWLDEFPLTDFENAARIYYFMLFLDHLGLLNG